MLYIDSISEKETIKLIVNDYSSMMSVKTKKTVCNLKINNSLVNTWVDKHIQ